MNNKLNEVVFKNENYAKDGVKTTLKKSKDARHAVYLDITPNEDNDISKAVFNLVNGVSEIYHDKLLRIMRVPLGVPSLVFEHLEPADKMSGWFFGNEETVSLFNSVIDALTINPDKSVTHIAIHFTYDNDNCISARLNYFLSYKESRMID